MNVDFDITGFEGTGFGHEVGRNLFTDRERHRRGEACGHDEARFARQIHADEPGLLLEH